MGQRAARPGFPPGSATVPWVNLSEFTGRASVWRLCIRRLGEKGGPLSILGCASLVPGLCRHWGF